MKKALLIGTLTAAALVALANIGVKLVGVRQQVGAMVSAYRNRAAPGAETAFRPAAPERGASVAAGAAPTQPVRGVQEAAPMPPEPAMVEPAALPGSGFDREAAINGAAEHDPGLAELLGNADPAVGAAVRDFVNSVDPPGASTDVR